VASQEGAEIIKRAPYVDVVFGPQTLHRLPEMLNARKALNRPQVDISFPEIEKFDHLPPAKIEGASAFVSIMEGCSKYCSYCVVPYTRGEEVSRPFEDVLVEVAGLADQGVKEVTLLGTVLTPPILRPCWHTWPISPVLSVCVTPPATPMNSRPRSLRPTTRFPSL
jgi:tRNA-2-methylthio-N6-dimethylallyladenosine synthase